MSNPIHRLGSPDNISSSAANEARNPDPDDIASSAANEVRDLGDVAKIVRELHDQLAHYRARGDSEVVSTVPSDNPSFEPERLRFPSPLDPVPVPEPPMRQSRLRDREWSLAGGGGGTRGFLSFAFAIFLVAVLAVATVVELPNIQSFIAKQRSAVNSVVTHFHGDGLKPSLAQQPNAIDPETVSKPRVATTEQKSTRTPSSADRRVAAINPSSTAPVANPSRGPAQAGSTSPALTTRSSAASLPATPDRAASAPAAAKESPNAPSVSVRSVKTPPLRTEKPVRSLGRDEIRILLEQGEKFVSIDDFASARLVFGRVAEAHDARGALALAATYDPIILARIGAKGAIPNVVKARQWYVKAREFGSPEAASRLQALEVLQARITTPICLCD